MTCDYDHDHWPIEVELKDFTKAYHLPKEKPLSLHSPLRRSWSVVIVGPVSRIKKYVVVT